MKILALLLLITSGVLGLILWLTRRKADQAIADKEEQIRELTNKNRELAQYEGILEVDRETERRRHAISQEQRRAQAEVQQLRQETEAEVEQQKREISDLKRQTREQQAQTLGSASQEAARIVEEANKRAEEIAGDAMTAVRDSKQLEATAKAMKNVIKGYGEEYLVPNRSLIDDLAEEFSHKEGGVELKTARERSRQMVKSGLAGTCDYAEPRRKETAIHFVVDAFNGKVDSILSRAKHDNFGKLDQEIKDAFSLVNHNGEAFRNARIQPQYLEARGNELRWAVAVNELRLQEREEQRRIKEQMREEERARREYEKAIREAANEERTLQDATAKARQELQAASDEQRAQYERQLQELEQKLREAEEKNQRAVSMAQQTKRGHVYVISNVGSFGDDVFKVGLTRRLVPLDRVRELGDASVPFEFDVHAMIFSDDAPALETKLQSTFEGQQVNKVNPRKEFFRTRLGDIKKVVDEMKVDVKWTMVAEAREYRETLAVEKSQGKEVRELPPPEPQCPEPPGPAREGIAPPTQVLEPKATGPKQPERQVKPQSQGPQEPESPTERHSPEHSAREHTQQKTIPCPSCKRPLVISTLQTGRNTCPHCNKSFKVTR